MYIGQDKRAVTVIIPLLLLDACLPLPPGTKLQIGHPPHPQARLGACLHACVHTIANYHHQYKASFSFFKIDVVAMDIYVEAERSVPKQLLKFIFLDLLCHIDRHRENE
jgi:hypothetical protein